MDHTKRLPEQILINIFDRLSPITVKNCCFVCKRWDVIISNSGKLMSNYRLCIDENENFKASETRRRYLTIVSKDWSWESLDAICQHDLRELQLENMKFANDSDQTVLHLLVNLPYLKSLTINIDLGEKNIFNDLKAQFDQLEYLNCPIQTIKLLKVKSLKEIHFTCGKVTKFDVYDFLKQQRKLKILSVTDNCCIDFFANPEILELDCRLTKFRYFSSNQLKHHEEFIKFLRIHQHTLETLQFKWKLESYNIVKKFVIENMKHLKSLEISFEEWVRIDEGTELENSTPNYRAKKEQLELYRRLYPQPTIRASMDIESLACHVFDTNTEIFGFFPNLKELAVRFPQEYFPLEEESEDMLDFISQKYVDLEKLEFRSIESPKAFFPNLKELILDQARNRLYLSDFIHRHSVTLETVTFKDVTCLQSDIVDAIMICPNFKHLCIIELERFGPLTIFRTANKSLTFRFGLSDYRSRCFTFPDDKLDYSKFIVDMKELLNC